MTRRSVALELLFFIAAAALGVLGYLFLLSALSGGITRRWLAVPAALFLALALLLLNARFLRSDGLSLAAIGLDEPRRRAREFLLAFAAGALLVLLWVGALALTTGARWHHAPGASMGAAIGLVVFTFFNNAAEELAYRAWLFLRLESSLGTLVAVTCPAILFTAAHVQSGIPWQSAIAGVFTTGLILALLFMMTRSLPLVLGFHLATNVVQELLGLRVGPATILAPAWPQGIATTGSFALAFIAGINLVIVMLIAVAIRRRNAGLTLRAAST